MSTDFHLRCESCDVDGPWIRRSAGGVSWHASLEFKEAYDAVCGPEDPPQESGERWRQATQSEWTAWLLDHEYHEQWLVTDG